MIYTKQSKKNNLFSITSQNLIPILRFVGRSTHSLEPSVFRYADTAYVYWWRGKTGLIIPMGYWALEQACQQIQEWERSNTQFYPIAVNLSALQFENKKLFSTLEGLLKNTKFSRITSLLKLPNQPQCGIST